MGRKIGYTKLVVHIHQILQLVNWQYVNRTKFTSITIDSVRYSAVNEIQSDSNIILGSFTASDCCWCSLL